MKKTTKTLALLTAFLLLAVLVLPVPTMAAEDEVDRVAWEYLQAVKASATEKTFTTKTVKDPEALMKQLLQRYPVLFRYYSGYQSMIYSDRLELTVTFVNQTDDPETVLVVTNDTQLKALLGLAVAELRSSVRFITANGYQPSDAVITDFFLQMQWEHYLSYMGFGYWSYTYTHVDDYGVRDYTFDLHYDDRLSAAQWQQWRNETEQVVLELAGTLFAKDMPEYLRVLRIHDWVVNNSRYNTADMDLIGNHNAYGALVRGLCVCEGYTHACNLLLRVAGVESVRVFGNGLGEAHAWNAVKIEGEWYMMDATWDDPVTYDGTQYLLHDYFLVTSDQLAKDHDWERGAYPVCNGTKYNAQTVLDLASRDPGGYTQYDPGAVMTQAKSKEGFRSMLAGTAPVLPTEPAPEPTPAPTAPAPTPTVPTPTVPTPSVPTPTAPAPSIPTPTVPTPTVPTPTVPVPTYPTPEEPATVGFGWILVLVLVIGLALLVLGGGTVAVLIVLKKRSRPSVPTYQPPSFGSGTGFGPGSRTDSGSDYSSGSRTGSNSGSGFSNLPKR